MLRVVTKSPAIIGESLLWNSQDKLLYWADIKQPALHRFDPASGEDRFWEVSSDIGAFALLSSASALVALREGLFRLDLESGKSEILVDAPFDQQLFRFNEGICDSAGRFWVGVMFDPLSGTPEPQQGSLYSFTLADGLREEPDRAELHNGMAWNEDGTGFYLAHSRTNNIYRYDFSAHTGLGERHMFAVLQDGDALPDGAAMDSDGGYWCALHGGSAIRRYNPDGTIDRDIALPVSQPTMCAFAGNDLATLYITSASDGMSEAQKASEPLAGRMFAVRPGRRGIERPYLVR